MDQFDVQLITTKIVSENPNSCELRNVSGVNETNELNRTRRQLSRKKEKKKKIKV